MSNATPDAQSDLRRCDRYPCDTAYQHGCHHVINGEMRHCVSVGSRMYDDLSGYRWYVNIIAWDGPNSTWQVLVHVDAVLTLDSDETEELGATIHRANVWALKANLKEAKSA